jgi:hypothetical protein
MLHYFILRISLFTNFPPFLLFLLKTFDILILTRIGSAPPLLANLPIYSVKMCVSLSPGVSVDLTLKLSRLNRGY